MLGFLTVGDSETKLPFPNCEWEGVLKIPAPSRWKFFGHFHTIIFLFSSVNSLKIPKHPTILPIPVNTGLGGLGRLFFILPILPKICGKMIYYDPTTNETTVYKFSEDLW